VLALLLSWWVSVFFVPLLGVWLLKVKPQPAAHHSQELFDSVFYKAFRRLVNACVKYRWLTIAATLLIFAAGIFGMGKVQQQFFPDSSRPEIMMEIWFPEGTSLQANEALSKQVEKRMLALKGVDSVSLWIGSGVPRFYLPLDQVLPQTNVSQFIIMPKDLATRESMRLALPALMAMPGSSCYPTARRWLTRCSFASQDLIRWSCGNLLTKLKPPCARTAIRGR